MTAPALPQAVRAIATQALALASLLTQADEIQWQPSITPKPTDDTTERSRGEHSDPTVNIVVDERRLALRDVVTEAEHQLELAVVAMSAAHRHLEDAIDRWSGN